MKSLTINIWALKLRDWKMQNRKMRDHSDVKFEGPKMLYWKMQNTNNEFDIYACVTDTSSRPQYT